MYQLFVTFLLSCCCSLLCAPALGADGTSDGESAPELLSQEAIEASIRNQPMGQTGVLLFRAALGPQVVENTRPLSLPQSSPSTMIVGGDGPTAGSPGYAIGAPPQAPVALALPATGVTEIDDDLAALRQKISLVVAQAIIHHRLHEIQGHVTVPGVGGKGVQRYRAVVGRGADGVFDSLNQSYLLWWARSQYEHELRAALREHLTRGLAASSSQARLRFLFSGKKLVPVETRSAYWEDGLAADSDETKKNRMRLFYFLRESVFEEVYGEFLPAYLAGLSPSQARGVHELVKANEFRGLGIIQHVVQWRLSHAVSAQEVTDIVWTEFVDAVYHRNKGAREITKDDGNPYAMTAAKLQNSDAEPNALPEESYFTRVFAYAIARAATLEDQGDILLFAGLWQKLRADGRLSSSFAFRAETMLYYLEKMQSLQEYPSVSAQVTSFCCRPLLIPLYDFLRSSKPQGGLTTTLPEWHPDLLEHTSRVLEETIIRKQGWFPPTQSAFAEAHAWLKSAAQDPPIGSVLLSQYELGAARRLLIELPPQLLSAVTSAVDEAGTSLLVHPEFGAAYLSCAQRLVQLFEGLGNASADGPEN